MADENTPAFYPRVGRTIAKNFRSAQPAPFIEDPRAMELPFEYADEKPTRERLEMDRRLGVRLADLERQKSADTSPLEKLAGGLQAGRFLGSAMTQGINSIPTRLVHGDKAAEKFMEDRIYKPEQPLAYEYAGDVGNFLEKLETEYKIPPLLPEAVALQFLTGPATAQAARAAGKGAVKAGMALERSMEPVVRGALERGGLPREMVLAMGANTQSNVMKQRGGNYLGGEKIMTPAEHADWLLKELGADTYNELGLGAKPPPAAGMKRGGKVSISNNPDTMMLEVNNQKMKNGVPAYGAGSAVTKMGLKAAKNEVPRLAMQFGNDLPLNMADDLIKRSPSVDRINMNYKDVTKRVPELTEAAQRLQAGELDRETYAKLVQALKPVKPYDFVPKPATAEEARGALREDARDLYGVPSRTLEAGSPVGLRLDIPAYRDSGVWVPTIHEQDAGFGAGKKIGHESVASVLNPEFGMSEKAALSIAAGKPKGTIATIKGDWNPMSEAEVVSKAQQYLKNPEWRQVGMDPERHSFFYDRETMAPVVNAEEVIQIGPLVLAKNPKYGKLEDFKYQKGGLANASEPHYSAAGAVIKQGLKAGRMSRAEAEAAGLYHPVSLGVKLRRPVSEIDYKAVLNPNQPMVPERKVSPEAIFKGAGIPYIGDSSRAGELITEIAGKKLETPVELQGGKNWMRVNTFKDKPNKSSSWASGTSVISDLNKKARIAAEQADDVYGLHTSMSPSGADFSSMPTKVLLAQFNPKAHDPVILDALDEEIRKLKPKFVGVRSPDLEQQLLGPGGGEMRKAFVTRLALKPFQDAGLPNVAEARYMVSHPELLEQPVGTVGGAIAKVDPRGVVIEDPLNVHYDYPTKQGGEYFAGFDVPMTTQEVFPEFFENRRAFNADKAGDRRAFDLSTPIQVFDQKWLDQIMPIYLKRRQELIGKKKGGAVKKPIKKAAGGAITGDDLIIEERPL